MPKAQVKQRWTQPVPGPACSRSTRQTPGRRPGAPGLGAPCKRPGRPTAVPESTHKRGSECAQAAALAVTHPRKYHPLCLSDSATVQCSQHLAWERGLKSQRNARRQSARPDCSASRMAGGQLREGWEALAPARRAWVLQSQNAPAWKESRTEFPFLLASTRPAWTAAPKLAHRLLPGPPPQRPSVPPVSVPVAPPTGHCVGPKPQSYPGIQGSPTGSHNKLLQQTI